MSPLHSLKTKVPQITLAISLLLFVAMIFTAFDINTYTLFAVSILMFFTCVSSASHLFGIKLTVKFIIIALALGLFAEYMGQNFGWFFGKYTFTEVLGPKMFGVPVVIPMMWFSLSYIGFVLGNLILERAPIEKQWSVGKSIQLSFFSAVLVTAYDLAADPYMVFELKAWIMEKQDGWWFGETLQGFVGWMIVAFSILMSFRMCLKFQKQRPLTLFKKEHAAIPLLIYAGSMGFQVIFSMPVETRTISLFAMGTPLLIALFSQDQWHWNPETGSN